MPRGKEGEKAVSLYLPDDEHLWARHFALEEGRPLADILTEVVRGWIKQNRGKGRREK